MRIRHTISTKLLTLKKREIVEWKFHPQINVHVALISLGDVQRSWKHNNIQVMCKTYALENKITYKADLSEHSTHEPLTKLFLWFRSSRSSVLR